MGMIKSLFGNDKPPPENESRSGSKYKSLLNLDDDNEDIDPKSVSGDPGPPTDKATHQPDENAELDCPEKEPVAPALPESGTERLEIITPDPEGQPPKMNPVSEQLTGGSLDAAGGLAATGPPKDDPLVLSAIESESASETARKSGLAWSAAIALFASVAFMTLLGSFADLNFGTRPWGVVSGIILGALIGFIQFFRTTSQILKRSDDDLGSKSLFSSDEDEKSD